MFVDIRNRNITELVIRAAKKVGIMKDSKAEQKTVDASDQRLVIRRFEKVGNRRLWVNSVIQALKAELEVIRCDHMAGRDENAIDDTKHRLEETLREYQAKLNVRPFTFERVG